MKFLMGTLTFIALAQGHANLELEKGTLTISASGGSASVAGGSGASAGDINLTLAYADLAKTQVTVSGTLNRNGKISSFSNQFPLSELKSIQLRAIGGNGADGYSGSRGQDGSNGSSGWDGSSGWNGCPPGDGRDGSDGSDGTDGSSGGDGGDGGHGGRGGKIVVNTSPDQNELMLLVKARVSGGSGGAGGSGGSGGYGGAGGAGGAGGRGGSNDCRDDEGKPTWGPDGRNGQDGRRGRDGNPGASGSSGRDGFDGRSGSVAYNLVSESGITSFIAPFDLQVTEATFLDDNNNLVLEPGERLYLSSLQITNRGPMPSPNGQKIKFTFLPSGNLQIPAELTLSLDPLAPGATVNQTLKKGTLTLQAPDQISLIGQRATTAGVLRINGISMAGTIDTGMAIGWPLSIRAESAKFSADFDVPKTMALTVKNVGAQAVGPEAQPLRISISWSAKTVPGSDVYVSLADGQFVSLQKTVFISNLTIPAKASAPLNLNVLFRNRKLLSSAAGTLRVSLRLPDENSGSDDTLQTLDQLVFIESNFKAVEWKQTIDLAGTRIQCLFPNLPSPSQEIAFFHVVKDKGSDKVQVRLGVPGSNSSNLSPIIFISSSRILPFYQKFVETWTAQTALDFLNKLVAPNSPQKSPWTFKSCLVPGVVP